MKAIEFESVVHRYPAAFRKPARAALDGVSFVVEEGDAFGFVGENGAGKSTAIKLLLGFVKPTAGRVGLNGLDPFEPSARASVGYVPEVPSLPANLTPREILRFGLALRGGSRSGGNGAEDALLERLGVMSVADKRVGQFSKGMAQRVALALALAGAPRLLILDEPLSGLDPKGRADVVDLLADFQREGGTLFFSSHVLHDVERLADRVALIHGGRIHAEHDVAELLARHQTGYVIRFHSASGFRDAAMLRQGIYALNCAAGDLPAVTAELMAAGAAILDIGPQSSLESRFLDMVA